MKNCKHIAYFRGQLYFGNTFASLCEGIAEECKPKSDEPIQIYEVDARHGLNWFIGKFKGNSVLLIPIGNWRYLNSPMPDPNFKTMLMLLGHPV